jgi:hypothetical protein
MTNVEFRERVYEKGKRERERRKFGIKWRPSIQQLANSESTLILFPILFLQDISALCV